jgi:hypothetical protein
MTENSTSVPTAKNAAPAGAADAFDFCEWYVRDRLLFAARRLHRVIMVMVPVMMHPTMMHDRRRQVVQPVVCILRSRRGCMRRTFGGVRCTLCSLRSRHG